MINKQKNQVVVSKIQLDYENIPLAVFLVGTNGSGKSSLRNYLNLSDMQVNIDPDIINRIYMKNFPKSYHIESARQALKMYNEAIKLELNICIESTLSGRGTLHRIIEAKNAGYYVLVYYVGLNSVELNLSRINERVKLGGHFIPEDLVRRRFFESRDNLILVKNYIDMFHVLDNSLDGFELQYSLSNKGIFNQAKIIETWALELKSDLM